jgi:dienelactone hydrolase
MSRLALALVFPLTVACGSGGEKSSDAGSGASSSGATSNGSGGRPHGGGSSGGSSSSEPRELPERGEANCEAFVVTGDATSEQGATWTYASTDAGVAFSLEGILFTPSGSGPFPAVILSHGKGGSVFGFSKQMAEVMRDWGMVAIGTMYTHASADTESNAPDGDHGASSANLSRALKTYELLECVGDVDLTRVAAHGHSMGAFITGEFVGAFPDLFKAASHTAGGTNTGPFATEPAVAAQIVAPYQIHHGDADIVVQLEYDQALADVLESNGVEHEFTVYPGYTHEQMSGDEGMLEAVRAWYTDHGVLP